MPRIKNLPELASVDIDTLTKGNKTVFSGIGPDTLAKFQARAKLQMRPDSVPYSIAPIDLPVCEKEVFFDIETDPMRDICYLHGFVERTENDNGTERYHAFFASDPPPEEEEKAFAEAWKYNQAVRPCVVYYYLGIHDQDDRDVPIEEGIALAQAWPGAQFLRTTGLGHRRILRDPDVIARTVAFIAS